MAIPFAVICIHQQTLLRTSAPPIVPILPGTQRSKGSFVDPECFLFVGWCCLKPIVNVSKKHHLTIGSEVVLLVLWGYWGLLTGTPPQIFRCRAD